MNAQSTSSSQTHDTPVSSNDQIEDIDPRYARDPTSEITEMVQSNMNPVQCSPRSQIYDNDVSSCDQGCDEMENEDPTYTALKRPDQRDEDHIYCNLNQVSPIYVNQEEIDIHTLAV